MRHTLLRGLFAATLAVSLTTPAVAQDKTPFARRNPVVEAVQKTKASIVTVKVPRPGGGKDMIGTGVVIDERGLIVTNKHVVGNNPTVNVRLHDGTDLTANVLDADPRWDLAVLRVKAGKLLPALKLTCDDQLMVGESVIAIGHPFGYSNTVSTGIISALGREVTIGDATIPNLIQTDASINPGNSGGPLLNINGELIGINVALRDGAQCIAFALNARDVNNWLAQRFSSLNISGVSHGLKCQERVVAETGEDRQRVVLTGVAASDAGLQPGDELRTVAERPVANAFDVERAFWGRKAGEQVALKVVREGRELTVNLTVSAGQGAGQTAAAGPMTDLPQARAAATRGVSTSDER